ncbi:MAG: sugar ABC transporter permease [Clostridiaceae bacterium]|jgi:putative aldouronate transport system permease protein|nr:sugar ABC transporter permease [Clostridiaceae bacterium]
MYGVQIAFREFDPSKGFVGGEFVGLKYFTKFINSFQFTDLIKNTFFLSFYSILAGFPVPIILALFINQIKKAKAKKFIQTVSYMPHFISVIVLVGMLSIFLSPSSGIVGHVYRSFGLDPINFMGATKYFRSIYVLSDIWQHSGWNSIIYIAALSAIDPTLYEAAEVDGANRWQKLIMIDIPSLVPTIIILLILNSGNIMNIGFEKVYLMQNSMNLPVSEVISTYVYKIGIMSNQISYASAIGLFNTMINFVFLVFVNFISKKTSDISLW